MNLYVPRTVISPRVITASSIEMELNADRPAVAVSSAVNTTGTVRACTEIFSLTAKVVVL